MVMNRKQRGAGWQEVELRISVLSLFHFLTT